MSDKILVTGGAGFIGSHLVDELIRGGNEVIIYDSLDPQVHPNGPPSYLNPKAKFIKADVRDGKKLKEALSGVDVVYHYAAAVGVGQSMYQVFHYVDVNTGGTANLLDVLANEEHSVRKLIVASSMSIYGEGAYECGKCGVFYPRLRSDTQLKSHKWEVVCDKCGSSAKPIPTPETKPLYSTSIYAISKKDQEEMSLCIGRAYGIPTVALRFFNVYGPRQSLSNPYTGVCAIFQSRIKNDNPPLIYEDGLQSRDFISVKDIVAGSILVKDKKQADYEMFNLGSGQPQTILGVARTLTKLYCKKLEPVIENKYRAGDIRHCYADISKIRKIGFAPSVDFESGMRDLVAWGEKQEAVDRTDEAFAELKKKKLVEA